MSLGGATVDGRYLDESDCLACLVRQASETWVTSHCTVVKIGGWI
jgi:hypothetical protein